MSNDTYQKALRMPTELAARMREAAAAAHMSENAFIVDAIRAYLHGAPGRYDKLEVLKSTRGKT